MAKDRIPIKKSLIPYRFNIALPDEIFTFEINYNEIADLFTLAVYKEEKLICAGEPLIYGMPLFKDIYKAGLFPAIDIIPIDESGKQFSVTYDNLEETVFLTIENSGGDEIVE